MDDNDKNLSFGQNTYKNKKKINQFCVVQFHAIVSKKHK